MQRTNQGSGTVRKAVRLLDVLGRHPKGLGLSEIARLTGFHRATAYRLLQSLTATGLADCGERDRRYRLGLRLLELAGALIQTLEVREVARPILAWLAATAGETAQLATLDRDEMVVLDRVDGPQPVTLQTRLGYRMSAHDTALGKAFLAFAPAAAVDRFLCARPLTPSTERTITDRAVFLAHLEEIRRLGYAVDNEEHRPTIGCVAAPVFDHGGQTVAAVGIAGPTFRLSVPRLRECGEVVKQAAARVSQALGHNGFAPAPPADTPGPSGPPRSRGG